MALLEEGRQDHVEPEEFDGHLAVEGLAGVRHVEGQSRPRGPSRDEGNQLDGQQKQEDNGEAEEGDGSEEAADVLEDGQLYHLLDGVEVGIVEVAEEPEDPRAQHFAQQEDERGEVEDVDHADEPVDKEGGSWRGVEAGKALAECRIDKLEAADVEPEAADEREHADLYHDQEAYLDHDVAQTDHFARAVKRRHRQAGVEEDEEGGEEGVADQGGDQALEVGLVHAGV